MVDPIRHLDVCAGAGGFSLGLGLADPRVQTVGYVERDGYASAVLVARMEDATLEAAPLWCGAVEDLRGSALEGLRGQVDLLTAGFPCQPWSGAGKGLGEEDERWLWPEIARLVRDVEPGAVLLENVSLKALGSAFDDLVDAGFSARPPIRVAAEDVGAPHRRARYFLFAVADAERDFGGDPEQRQPTRRARELRDGGRANARHPRASLADSDGGRRQVERKSRSSGEQGALGDEPLRCGVDWVSEWPPGRGGDWSWVPEEAQPGFPGVDDGLSPRVDRLRVLGNGVLPQVVAAAWTWFLENEERPLKFGGRSRR